jgi:hypothetical protein
MVEAETPGVAEKHAQYYERSPLLLQGTLLHGVVVLDESPESTAENLNPVAEVLDVIVLTQSCDIGKTSQTRLLVAEVDTYTAMTLDRAGTEFAQPGYRKHLVRNTATSDVLLPPCAHLAIEDYLIVNFRQLHVIPVHRIPLAPAEGYVCLASPFREQLSQQYATFHMRVGLPTPPLKEFEKHQPLLS